MTDAAEVNAAPVSLHDVYIAQLRVHAVTLVWFAYRRLKATDFRESEEDDITGELVRAIRHFQDEPASPDWTQHYVVREQVPQNVEQKRGKRRPKMDIEVERHQRGNRPCLGFEAKRLGRGKDTGGYLGSEGLGAFLTGYYPTTHGDAGMLGYIQEANADSWSAKLARELLRNATKNRTLQGREWQRSDVEPTMPAFRSHHTDAQGNPLLVTHVLLPFVI
jgi:hypothetical protein